MTEPVLSARIYPRVSDIGKAGWDRLAGDGNPFLRHDFLNALEQSGSATSETGWLPRHIVIRDAAGAPRGAMPLYLKSHSRGEYVFDHNWAEAYEQAGGRYYPKLISCIPFTPVTGQRFLAQDEQTKQSLLAAADQLLEAHGFSSLHLTFLTEEEAGFARSKGLLIRTDQQFHWQNRDYGSFDDFLANLSARKRKTIKRERRDALKGGIEIKWLTGTDIREDHWDHFFGFYTDTGRRKWGRPYLNREFFSRIGETMADRILLMLCIQDGRTIAGALNFIGSDTLYGRYWGCVEDHPFLHFETCYYQAIDYAIEKGLRRVEAGAQGPHKIARGYEPVKTYSAHLIADPGFRRAVANFLKQEQRLVDQDMEYLEGHLPFRAGR